MEDPTIRELLDMSRTSHARKNYKTCKVQKKKFNKAKGITVYNVKDSKEDSNPKGHLVGVWLDPESDKANVDKPFKCKCTCPAWVYWGSDYHAKENDFYLKGLVGPRGNGSAPDIRDPARKNLLCKHVYATIVHISNNK